MTAGTALARARALAERHFWRLFNLGRERAAHLIYERGLIDTSPRVMLDTIGLDAPGRNDHQPTSWFFLNRAFASFKISRDDVLVDFGSGMGRAIYVAARQPFGRIVGIEIAQTLNDVALENIRRLGPKLRCSNIEIITGDALEFDVPDDMTYAFMFNPFSEELFSAVLGNIVGSLDRRPRRVTLLYVYPKMAEAVTATGRFTLERTIVAPRSSHDPHHRMDVYISAA